ncbi:flavin reductase family protein [Nocardia abscessus]|uniref:flavin reductase family protein n=1 Tax=Nocardia abscessus TaxID=120957 RepID=UPI0024574650|nr:flavin reductase [Nocardia abscessus]
MAEDTPLGVAHRLLAPRIAYLVGTRSRNGTANLIPVSNLTSVSTDPQQIAIAVYKKWATYENLCSAAGFSVTVPTIEQLDGVWKLGARYSKYPATEPAEKLSGSGLEIDFGLSAYGPVVPAGLGWLSCRTIARLDLGGDHGIVIGRVEAVWFNTRHFNSDGTPKGASHPLMQQTGNLFTTTADELTPVQYF